MTLIALFKNTRTFLSRRGSAIFMICFSNIFFICKIAKKHEKNMRKIPSSRPLLKTDSFLRISSLQISWFLEMFKVNNRNTWTRCEICSKLTIKTPERRQLWAGNYQLGPHNYMLLLGIDTFPFINSWLDYIYMLLSQWLRTFLKFHQHRQLVPVNVIRFTY